MGFLKKSGIFYNDKNIFIYIYMHKIQVFYDLIILFVKELFF